MGAGDDEAITEPKDKGGGDEQGPGLKEADAEEGDGRDEEADGGHEPRVRAMAGGGCSGGCRD